MIYVLLLLWAVLCYLFGSLAGRAGHEPPLDAVSFRIALQLFPFPSLLLCCFESSLLESLRLCWFEFRSRCCFAALRRLFCFAALKFGPLSALSAQVFLLSKVDACCFHERSSFIRTLPEP